MFSPPLMIMSFIRSSTWTYPSASARPTSPVRSQPSARNVSAVASGRFQYPPVTTGPLTQSSPTTSGSGASCIVPSTATATLTPGTGCPTVQGRSSQSRPTAQVTIEVASVRPQTLAKVTPGSRLTAFVRNASATGAPPKQTVRSAGRSAGSKAGSDSISWIIAVTPAKKVIRCSISAARMSAARNWGWNTRAAPCAPNPTSWDTMPVAWNMGATTRVRSSAVAPNTEPTVAALNTRLPCDCMAPLGLPVVPEVYRMFATSVLAAASPGSSAASSPGAVSSRTSQCGHTGGTRAAIWSSTTTNEEPESDSTYSISGAVKRVLTSTATAPASCTPPYATA